MNETFFVAGDLSGIQDYVLSVSTKGGGQARRLRARSFFVQVVEELAAREVFEAFGVGWEEAVVFRGGGQFLLRISTREQPEEKLRALRERLEAALRQETQAALALTLAWGFSPDEALHKKEVEKRRLWASTTIGSDGWLADAVSLEPLTDKPCQICNHNAGARTGRHDEEEIRVCVRCYDDTEIGRKLPITDHVELCGSGGDFQALGWGLRFDPSTPASEAQPLRTPKLHVPESKTFEQMANKATGDNLLAVLKADVDRMGTKLAALRGDLRLLKEFSRALDDFFSRQVQHKLEKEPSSLIYTIYSGGDDLLMVGPWDLILDFAEEVQRDFAAGPGGQYGLTFSAGIALTNYRIPIRHGVEKADELLEWAKGRQAPPHQPLRFDPKDCCAALGWVWKWDRHLPILSGAKQIRAWINGDVCGRAMAHRLLRLAERADPLRAAHWAYEVGRNFPKSSAASVEAQSFREWGVKMLAETLEDPDATRELAVQLRYALTATRPRKETS